MRPIRTFAAALILAGLALPIGSTAPANALALHTTCVSTLELLTLEFKPPLGLSQVSGRFNQVGIDPTATCAGGFTGTVDIQNVHGTGNLSCTTSSGVSGTNNLKWSDNTNSHVQISGLGIEGAPSSASKVVVLSGSVTSGRFNGDDVVITFTATVSDTTACVNNALASLSGNPTLTFATP